MLLVTGGAGYIGAHFCALLERLGHEYVVLDDLSRGHASFVPRERLIVGDVGDGGLVADVVSQQRVDTVVHFAAYAYVGESVGDPALYYENNVVRGITFLGALRDAGVRRIVFSSSCATYGNSDAAAITESHPQLPTNPYGETKLVFERVLKSYARAYGLAFAILRYFNAAGADPDAALFECHEPETHLIPLAVRAALQGATPLDVFGSDYPTPDGTCVRDYIHVSDLADAHLRAVAHLRGSKPSLTLNLGTGRAYSIVEVMASVERACGRPVPHRFAPRRPGDPPSLVADASLALRELGWSPRYRELDGIVATALAGERRRLDALHSATPLERGALR
jgi:UDP-arabinose 4-epimerase